MRHFRSVKKFTELVFFQATILSFSRVYFFPVFNEKS
jgi:hypothetical protein